MNKSMLSQKNSQYIFHNVIGFNCKKITICKKSRQNRDVYVVKVFFLHFYSHTIY